METLGIRDIIGPIMIGPSSSHTAGALRIAYMARRLSLAEPKKVDFFLLGSFAHTLTGHGTDKALVAGMLGLETDDLRIRDSFALAKDAGLDFSFTPMPEEDFDHPNTVIIHMLDTEGNTMRIRGESIGGGAAVIRSIDGIEVYITGENTSIVIRQRDKAGVLAHIAKSISDYGVNIATTRVYRERKGDAAYTILETDQAVCPEIKECIEEHPAIKDVRIIPGDTMCGIEKDDSTDSDRALAQFESLDFSNGSELLAYCELKGVPISEAFLARESALAASFGVSSNTIGYLERVLATMKHSAYRPIEEAHSSMGGLIGGEAMKLAALDEADSSLCDNQLSCAIAFSMAVLETNASMGRIVAAPTAGSAGVIPGVLLALQQSKNFDDETLYKGLITAAAIGYIITRNATVSGAEGGCQAEVGSAAAMAAAAATELMGGTPLQCFNAAGNAITNMMGLVCDPVAGLVEVPCQKRNASGAATALVSAQIALAGIDNLVDFDQTVEAMRKVGRSLPFELRESALGGIAATPAACGYCASCTPGGSCA